MNKFQIIVHCKIMETHTACFFLSYLSWTVFMLDSAIYRAGLDRGEIEMGFAMECN